jgi:hypothetical protein
MRLRGGHLLLGDDERDVEPAARDRVPALDADEDAGPPPT